MNKTEFKKCVAQIMSRHYPGTIQWVWTWRGEYPTGLPGITGYFLYTENGQTPQLWFAEWSQGYPIKVRSVHRRSWKLLSLQDQSLIKGSWGQIPAPEAVGA